MSKCIILVIVCNRLESNFPFKDTLNILRRHVNMFNSELV